MICEGFFIFILIRHIPVPAGQESESIEFFRINDIYLISVDVLPVDSHGEADSFSQKILRLGRYIA